MPCSIQTNKEFVDAAGITERDAFIAVAIRRIVAEMMEIPAQKLVADVTVESIIYRVSAYSDWDSSFFAMCLEEYFCVDISCEEWEKGCELAKAAGYPNWFYNPDGYKQFAPIRWLFGFSYRPDRQTTFGEWVRLAIEVVLSPVREKIDPPADWPGLDASDLESDAIAQRSPVHNGMFYAFWTIMGIAGIIAIIIMLALIFR